jgi:Outer membrane receptor for ferrienterochelin and colicins
MMIMTHKSRVLQEKPKNGFVSKMKGGYLAILIVGCSSSLWAGNNAIERRTDHNMVINANTRGTEMVDQKQNITATGTINDATGAPLPGVSIIEKGNPSNGTVTDINGRFSLSVPVDAILEISYVGFEKTEVKSGSGLMITMQEESTALGDVVVVGYGTQQKVNLTGSVATLDSKTISSRPIQNISSGIQGLMPGVTVMSGEGRPGQDGATIRVRGVGTLNAANPYILIDGVESGTMNALDPNDIESISVLKDAASAAIYGSKASNGVILITTKRGKTGKAKITYNGYTGIQQATNTIDRMSSGEYAEIYNQVLQEAGKAPRFFGRRHPQILRTDRAHTPIPTPTGMTWHTKQDFNTNTILVQAVVPKMYPTWHQPGCSIKMVFCPILNVVNSMHVPIWT